MVRLGDLVLGSTRSALTDLSRYFLLQVPLEAEERSPLGHEEECRRLVQVAVEESSEEVDGSAEALAGAAEGAEGDDEFAWAVLLWLG